MENTLCPQKIQQNTVPFFHTVSTVGKIPSTNRRVKQLAQHTPQGYVLIADGQTEGRGRNGKVFHSPQGKGLYLSLLLKPDFDIYHSLLVTAAAAVAAAEAVDSLCPVNCSIKWVNDIYINDKKIGGILCESALKPGTALPEYMVVGVGLNTHISPMPREISAASLEDFAAPPDRNRLAARFLNRFYCYYSNLDSREFMDIYRRKSCTIGREITVYENNTAYTAIATDVDDMGGLVIKTAAGLAKTLTSGEITIRKNSL